MRTGRKPNFYFFVRNGVKIMIKSKQPIRVVNARNARRKTNRKTETPEDD